MIIDIPDEMIREAAYFQQDESYLIHLALEVITQYKKSHPEVHVGESKE